MGGVDLTAELFAAAAAVAMPELRRMEALGVPKSSIARLAAYQPPFGLQRVEEIGDGLYQPSEDGPVAVIIPVMEFDVVETWGIRTPISTVIDLIAFRPDNPNQWRWRVGDAWALGAYLLFEDAPIELVANPLEWLAKGGDALCLLDWTMTPRRWEELRSGPPLVSPDTVLQARLNDAYQASMAPIVMDESKWVYRDGRYIRAD